MANLEGAHYVVALTMDDAPVTDLEFARPYLRQAPDSRLIQMAAAALLVG